MAFVEAIVDDKESVAHSMLTAELRAVIKPVDIGDEYRALADDMGGVQSIGEASEILTDWPDKAVNEVAIVYVPLQGDTYAEAITVTVAQVDRELAISQIEWGRP